MIFRLISLLELAHTVINSVDFLDKIFIQINVNLFDSLVNFVLSDSKVCFPHFCEVADDFLAEVFVHKTSRAHFGDEPLIVFVFFGLLPVEVSFKRLLMVVKPLGLDVEHVSNVNKDVCEFVDRRVSRPDDRRVRELLCILQHRAAEDLITVEHPAVSPNNAPAFRLGSELVYVLGGFLELLRGEHRNVGVGNDLCGELHTRIFK
mmetsp:Transcript_23516/g.26983  ORF Transcript_23516/g.26983 Transcript_23516/m.26983 type:complete len:205 (-) Transcript_23516:19-633(-)